MKYINHRRNKDGYLRVRVGKRLVMHHRMVWEEVNGPIPEGYSIHHVNNIRDDNHLDNLQLIKIPDHAILTNKERTLRRKSIMTKEDTLQTLINKGIPQRTAYRWIKEHKQE